MEKGNTKQKLNCAMQGKRTRSLTFAYVELVTFLLKSKIFTITHACTVIEAEEGFTLTFVGREVQRMTPLGRTPTGLRCCVSCEGELALHI